MHLDLLMIKFYKAKNENRYMKFDASVRTFLNSNIASNCYVNAYE